MISRDYCLTSCPQFGDTFKGCAGRDYIIYHPDFQPDCPRTRPAPDNRVVLARLSEIERRLNFEAANRAIRQVEREERAAQKPNDGLAARYTE